MIKKTLLFSLLTFAVGTSAQAVDISVLRALAGSPPNYEITDTTTTYSATGVVNTWNTLTPSNNAAFYFQDGTGAIGVFVGDGFSQLPAAGDNITVTGQLGQFRGVLQFTTFSPSGVVTITNNSSGNPLPTPLELDWALLQDAAYMEPRESSHVVFSNVLFDLGPGATFTDFDSRLITNSANPSETFQIFIRGGDTFSGIVGTPVPTGLTTVFGVIGQNDTTSPFDSSYQLLISRPEDIIPKTTPPIVEFTNTLSNLIYPGDAEVSSSLVEYALRPGETLTIETLSYDQDGSNITINPVQTGLPTGASWTFGSTNGTELGATFTYTPVVGSAGTEFDFTLVASSTRGTNTSVWTVYVPTATEQNIVISEFLADPSTDTNSLYFNPLNRPSPGSTNAFKDDEFVEIVNLNASLVDLIGWKFGDSSAIRHTFFNSFIVFADDTGVIYGGQLNADPVPPVLPGFTPSAPFSDAGSGSILNNGGDSIRLYNGSDNLVARVVYTGSTDGVSSTRFPALTDDFMDSASVVCTNVSPGLRPDQQAYSLGPITATQPTITGIPDQDILVNTATPALPFTVGDAVTPAGSLTLLGISSNPTLVPNGNIVFGGSGASRTVTVTPATNQTGVADITVSVGNAAFLCASTNFQVLVQGTNAPAGLFCDDFDYPDGSLITNSAFVWTNHSGTLGQMQVTGGKAQVTFAGSEDVNAVIPSIPTTGPVYYSFTVSFSALPGGTGSYFAHLKNTNTTFRARVWAQTNGAAAGQFRLGIANTSDPGDVVQFPQDLSLGTTYRATVRHSLDTGESMLWVDAANEGDTSVTTTDGTAPGTMAQFAFRQTGGIGTLEADDLIVGTAFASVVPPAAPTLAVQSQGSDVVLTWGDPTFSLQAAPVLTGTYTNVTGATSPHTNAASGSQTFYRLFNSFDPCGP